MLKSLYEILKEFIRARFAHFVLETRNNFDIDFLNNFVQKQTLSPVKNVLSSVTIVQLKN